MKLNPKHCFTDFAVGSQALEPLPSGTSLSFFPEEIEEKNVAFGHQLPKK